MAKYPLLPVPFVLFPATAMELRLHRSIVRHLPLWGETEQIVGVQWFDQGRLHPVGVLASVEILAGNDTYVTIRIAGEQRYYMTRLRERKTAPPMEVTVEPLPDREEVPHHRLMQIVIQLHRQLLEALHATDIPAQSHAIPLSYRLAALWLQDSANRQHFLELQSESQRLQLLRAHLQSLQRNLAAERQRQQQLRRN